MIDPMFSIQLLLTFTLFLLNKLWHLGCFGKCLDTSLRNVLPMFVCALLLKGGLYQIMFLRRSSGSSGLSVLVVG